MHGLDVDNERIKPRRIFGHASGGTLGKMTKAMKPFPSWHRI